MASSREEIAMKRTSPVTGGLAVLLIVCSVLGFSTDDAMTSLGIEETLFDAEHPLELTLEADLKPVLRDIGDERPDRPARLWYLRPTCSHTISVGWCTRAACVLRTA